MDFANQSKSWFLRIHPNPICVWDSLGLRLELCRDMVLNLPPASKCTYNVFAHVCTPSRYTSLPLGMFHFPQKNHQARDDTIYKHLHPVMVSVCQRFSNINCRDRKQKHAKHSAKHYKPKRPNWRKTQPAWSTNGIITYTAMGAKSSHVTY